MNPYESIPLNASAVVIKGTPHVLLGLTKGEIALVVIIFTLIYTAGLLPKVVKLFVGKEEEDDSNKA